MDLFKLCSGLSADVDRSDRYSLNTSYEKALGERRGSVPALAQLDNIDNNSTSSPASKIANFFSRRPFKSNLKRTKSVTKLDRKRSGSALEHESHKISSSSSPLKRSFSLGRISRKSTASSGSVVVGGTGSSVTLPGAYTPDESLPATIDESPPGPVCMRTSRSHESLLITNSPFHTQDLTAADVVVRPLHHSILKQDNCFQVMSKNNHKYYSCRSAAEREKWLHCLRRTMNPDDDKIRRTHNSLKIWVQEAKNTPPKKRYFCEICLDRTLYARTSSKTKGDMLFWGEQFDFSNLPSVDVITVNLYREPDKKRKKEKNVLVGYINIPVTEIHSRHLIERWYTASCAILGKGKEKNELPIIRIKAKYQTIEILPMVMYKNFIQYLTDNYLVLVDVLEPLVSVKAKTDVATSLVHIFQNLGQAKKFLTDIVMAEVDRLDNEHMTFRGNSIATKSIEAYMKLVGDKYLHDTLSDFVKSIIEFPDDCEVDPSRVLPPASLQQNQTNLMMYCEMAWVKIINSFCYFPKELKEVFASFRECCHHRGKEDISDNLISASIFLRFLCPAILSPSLFGLSQEYPDEKSARNLTLIAKTIQSLANFTKFGGKEEYMTYMNVFVEREWATMKSFLNKISCTTESSDTLDFEGYIDLGKELSILHSLLVETLDKVLEPSEKRLDDLTDILKNITHAVDNPDLTLKRPRSVAGSSRTRNYDNVWEKENTPVRGDVLYPPASSSTPELRRNSGARNLDFRFGDADLTQVYDRCVMSNLARAHRACQQTTHEDNAFFSALEDTSLSPSASFNRPMRDLKANEEKLNESWNQMVRAAEVINGGEFIDLIPFSDDRVANGGSGGTADNRSEISQTSNVASSGYQSYGASFSQSSSPVDSAAVPEITPTPRQPLSFANPVYRHHQHHPQPHHHHHHPANSSSHNNSVGRSKKVSSVSSGSTSSEDGSLQRRERKVPPRSPVIKPVDLNVPRFTGSSRSDECLLMPPSGKARHYRSSSLSSSPGCYRSASLTLASPTLTSPPSPGQTSKSSWMANQDKNISRSADFSVSKSNSSQQSAPVSHMRRTATDTVISTTSHSGANWDISPGWSTPPDSPRYNPANSQRRASLPIPTGSIRMGVRSVQHKLQAQELSKVEYESEIDKLSKQLAETQARLREAEEKLHQKESNQEHLIRQWQHKLENNELSIKPTEKDGQMKGIIQRLITVEEELCKEQQELHGIVGQKERIIQNQDRRLHALDAANNRLLDSLGQLKHQYNITPCNGVKYSACSGQYHGSLNK
ncbi:disabled homolog 2-interacting protein-like isoform X2 [Tubulanus polymorphus]|uniref:disabled homolog 2-interacting protein-like isoform X2 n=1 Tax=Tubulanus polymorphus TaxID=672921 RepID=UPI003DA2FE36